MSDGLLTGYDIPIGENARFAAWEAFSLEFTILGGYKETVKPGHAFDVSIGGRVFAAEVTQVIEERGNLRVTALAKYVHSA